MPGIIVKGVMAIVKQIINKKANFNLDDIDVLKNVENCRMPALFLTSKNDTLINHKHTEKIFEKYKGAKKLEYIEGDHNEARKSETISNIINFLVSHFGI